MIKQSLVKLKKNGRPVVPLDKKTEMGTEYTLCLFQHDTLSTKGNWGSNQWVRTENLIDERQ